MPGEPDGPREILMSDKLDRSSSYFAPRQASPTVSRGAVVLVGVGPFALIWKDD